MAPSKKPFALLERAVVFAIWHGQDAKKLNEELDNARELLSAIKDHAAGQCTKKRVQAAVLRCEPKE